MELCYIHNVDYILLKITYSCAGTSFLLEDVPRFSCDVRIVTRFKSVWDNNSNCYVCIEVYEDKPLLALLFRSFSSPSVVAEGNRRWEKLFRSFIPVILFSFGRGWRESEVGKVVSQNLGCECWSPISCSAPRRRGLHVFKE